MNRFAKIGRLTNDPEIKVTTNGKKVTTFSLAVRRPYTKDKTDFFECRAWGTTAETIVRFFHKGDPIAICGYEVQERWESDGRKLQRYYQEIESFDFIGGKSNVNDSAPQYSTGGNGFDELAGDDELSF